MAKVVQFLLLSLFLSVSCFQTNGWTIVVRARHHQRQSSSFFFRSRHQLASSPADSNEKQKKQRRRKNKYEKFSKVADKEADPLEELLQDSAQKNEKLQQELLLEKQKKRPPKLEIAPLPPLSFPDAKEIDPNDPTTFGYVKVGTIAGAHGVHGWMKCLSETDFAVERLCTPGIRHLKPLKRRAPRQVVLLEGRHRQGDEYLIKLEGYDDRDAIQRLRGSTLYVRTEERAEPDLDEYLVSDLVGLEVFLHDENNEMDRKFVGKVAGIVFADEISSVPGMADLLEVMIPKGQGGTTSLRDELVLIPLVPQIVPTVDVKGGAIYIDPPAGLLDLTYVREDKVRIKGLLPEARA